MRARRKITMQIRLCLRLPTLAASWICRTFRKQPRDQQQPAILVIRLDGLGDCVLTLPLLDHLRRRFPRARISVLTTPAAAALLQHHPSVDEVIPLRPARRRFLPFYARALVAALRAYWTTLRGRHFDIAISARWDVDVYMATFLCATTRAALTVGFEDAATPFKASLNRGFQRTWNLCVPAGPLQHEVLHALALARALGCDAQPSDAPRLPVSPGNLDRASRWTGERHGRLPVALGLPAADPKRRWTADGYIAALRLLDERLPVFAVLLADEDTAAAAQTIAAAFPHSTVAMRRPLPETAAILKQSAVFIGTDSGLGHIAAAVGCPTITLSPHPLNGDPAHPNSPLRFRPYSPRAVVLQPPTGRPGCESACTANNTHCIADITPQQVAAAAMTLLPADTAEMRSNFDLPPSRNGLPDQTRHIVVQQDR